MRLQFGGQYSLDEFQEAITKFIKNLKDNNIETLMGVNLYFRPCVSGNSIDLLDQQGNEIEHMFINYDNKRKFSPTTSDLSIVVKTPLEAETSKV